jgi:hypothetical protein
VETHHAVDGLHRDDAANKSTIRLAAELPAQDHVPCLAKERTIGEYDINMMPGHSVFHLRTLCKFRPQPQVNTEMSLVPETPYGGHTRGISHRQ